MSESFIIKELGIYRKKFYNWKAAYGKPLNMNCNLPKNNWLTTKEREDIVNFYLEHENDGYRRCAYMMIDKDVVYATPSTVYSVLSNSNAIRSRNVKKSKKGTGFNQPSAIHKHWHSDITNISVGDMVYFLISILDGYSRSIIAWDLRNSMKSQDIGIVFQKAKEFYPDVHPRCITDNGKQYKCKEFKTFVKSNEYSHVTTSPYYPQSNGKQERFHGSLKSECIRLKCPLTLDDAKEVIEEYIKYYNNTRLHSAIGYVAPIDKMNSRENEIFDNRNKKLKQRRIERKIDNN